MLHLGVGCIKRGPEIPGLSDHFGPHPIPSCCINKMQLAEPSAGRDEKANLAGWAITAHQKHMPEGKTVDDEVYWHNWFRKYAKKWVFQIEKGEGTGRVHMQGEMLLYKKKRLRALERVLQTDGEAVGYLRPKVGSARSLTNYAGKADTRIKGPWSSEADNVPFVDERFKDRELYTWQRQIKENVERYYGEDRTINVLMDDGGCAGKSSFSKMMKQMEKGWYKVKCHPDAHRMEEAVIKLLKGDRQPKCILLDNARARPMTDSLWYFIEDIKNGEVCDFRYKYTEFDFNPPQIWLFTNKLPATKMLSADRWKIWWVNGENELIKYSDREVKQMQLQASRKRCRQAIELLEENGYKVIKLPEIRETFDFSRPV